MNEEFDLYGDDYRVAAGHSNISPDEPDNESVISVDCGKNSSLYQLIEPVRIELLNKPDQSNIILYLVCGKECSKDLDLFVNYLLTLNHNLNIYLRGFIHPEIFGLLIEKPVRVDKNCKLIYNRNKLHTLMSILLKRQDVLRKFLQRFIDTYHNFPEEILLDVSELNLIGIEVEKF